MPTFTPGQGARRNGQDVLDIKITTMQEQSQEYDYGYARESGSDHTNSKHAYANPKFGIAA